MSSRVFSPGDCWAKLSKLETNSLVRRACWPILRAMLACSDSGSAWAASNSEYPRIAARGLLISCAAPDTNWASEASFSRCTSSVCRRFIFSRLERDSSSSRTSSRSIRNWRRIYEQAQHQHGRQRNQQAELSKIGRRRVAKPCPISHHRKRKHREHGQAGRQHLPARELWRRGLRRRIGFTRQQSRPDHPAHRSNEGDVVEAAGVILAAGDGGIQRQGTNGVKSRGHKQVPVDLFPRPPGVPSPACRARPGMPDFPPDRAGHSGGCKWQR